MSKTIYVRNVPEKINRRLKTQAAEAGMSISDYLISELKEVVKRPALAVHRDSRQHRPDSE